MPKSFSFINKNCANKIPKTKFKQNRQIITEKLKMKLKSL